MSKEFIFGHQNPDTDAINAAKAYAYLQTKLGYEVEAVALGEPNDETKFVLDYFDEPNPRVISAAQPEVDSVMLVDHNEFQQSVSDIKDVTVTHVVDHHKVGNFATEKPLYMLEEPLGCTSTIIFKLFKANDITIPTKIAGLMLSAIISDTLLLQSPTTTDTDRKAVEELAKIADVDYQDYGIKMLKAGTNVDSSSADELVDQDAKSFTMGGKSVRIDQINVVDLQDILKRTDEIKTAMNKASQENGFDLYLVLVTNVLDSNSALIVTGDPKDAVEQAFNGKLNDADVMNLPGVVSRKKQVVPPLTEAFE